MENYAIGIDVGGTKTLLIVLDSNQNSVYEKKVPSSKDWKFLVEIIKEATKELKIADNEVGGIGIGMASAIEPSTNKVVDAPALGWKDFDLVSNLKSEFSFPLMIENDVNCALIAENKMGAAQDCDPVLYISIGTGLGGALMVGGKIVHGANNMAGEIGYQLDKEDYKKGGVNLSGQFGASENKISGTALGNHFSSSEDFFESLQRNDPSALALFDEFSIDLSILIANSVSLLNPEKVVLGGGLSKPLEPYLDTIQEKLRMMTPIPTKIEISKLGERAGALGAAVITSEKTMLDNLKNLGSFLNT
jgi:glucokinase